ncbi:hypothetical protein [Abyssalbus ytuae]|uniref:Adenylosuccinate synthetase n=1 Tax=Abyssalbus ytuae TaxID=2926907 RepID=A0A9E7CUZ1_9FLAO|nr:hypothetical protein [Abyssalbus ytuae]UOB19167.1 hypothetical protein MQE35_07675 [Abyssalbus ytuae]
MNNLKNIKWAFLLLFSIMPFSKIKSQIPTEVPHPDNNKPVDFSSPFDIIVFIILPIMVIVFFILWKRKKK